MLEQPPTRGRALPVLEGGPPMPDAAHEPFVPADARLAEYRPDGPALPRFTIWTLGCQMNRSDSEEMAGRLLAAGCVEAPTSEESDLIVINTRAPHLTPIHHPASAVVYAAKGSDVQTVMVAGSVLVRDRPVTTIALEEVMAHVCLASRDLEKPRMKPGGGVGAHDDLDGKPRAHAQTGEFARAVFLDPSGRAIL